MFLIELLGIKINPAKSAQNPGVVFDKNITFRSHISAACSSSCFHMQDLRRIRRHLDLDSAKLLATALVSGRLDYCNSLPSPLTHTHMCWTLLIPGRLYGKKTCGTTNEVHRLVLRAPCKSSDLDPIPTSLVKDCIDILITPITSIINLSLT